MFRKAQVNTQIPASILTMLILTILLSTVLIGTSRGQNLANSHSNPNPVRLRNPSAPKLNFESKTLTDGTDPQWVAVGDFNKDGKLDFANVDYSNGGAGSVSVFLGNGNGTFQTKVDYATGEGPDGIVAIDVHG